MPESKNQISYKIVITSIASLVVVLLLQLLETWFYRSIYAGKAPPGIRESAWNTFMWSLPSTLRILELVFAIVMLLLLASRIRGIERVDSTRAMPYLLQPLAVLIAGLTLLLGCDMLLRWASH